MSFVRVGVTNGIPFFSLSIFNQDYEGVNLGTGEDIKLKDLALLIKNVVGFEGEIKYDLSKPDGTLRKLLDVSKMKALGWKPRISLEEGIKRVYMEIRGN